MPFYLKINVAFIATIAHFAFTPEAGFAGSVLHHRSAFLRSPVLLWCKHTVPVKKFPLPLRGRRGCLTPEGSPSSQLPKLEHPSTQNQIPMSCHVGGWGGLGEKKNEKKSLLYSGCFVYSVNR